MTIILGGPGTGKTKEILALSAKNNIPVLCESVARRERLLVKAEGYGFSIPVPICYEDITPEVKEVYVDDVKKLLEAVFHVSVNGISVNCEVPSDLQTLK